MAGLGAFLAAGAAAGIGQGMVAQAKLDFEAAKQRAAQEARAKERAEDREFQTKRDATNFDQQLKLKDIDNSNANARLDRTESFQERRERERREFDAAEKQKDREAASERDSELLQGEDQTAYRVRGDKATPIVGADGKPVRGLGARSTTQDRSNQYRLAIDDAIKAGAGAKDEFGGAEPHNWTKSVARARALGIDIRSPGFAGEVQAGLEEQAARDKGITDKQAWVEGRLRALGIKDPIAGGEAPQPRMRKPDEGAAAPSGSAAAPAAKPSAVKEGTRAINRETGQTMVFTGGKWVAQ